MKYLTAALTVPAVAVALAAALSLSGCGNEKQEVRDIRQQVQLAYGQKRYKDALAIAEQGLPLSVKANGETHSDTLYLVQAVAESHLALNNDRSAAQALTRELNYRQKAGQPEEKLQARRTLAIKLAEEAGDKATAIFQAVAVSRGIEMGPGKEPQPVYRSETTYPPEQYRRQVEGDVRVRFSLDANGAVTDAAILSSTPARVFDQVAMDSFRKWRFTPMLDAKGNPVPSSGHTFTLAFRMGR